MAVDRKFSYFIIIMHWLLITLANMSMAYSQKTVTDATIDARTAIEKAHITDSVELLVFIGLLILTILSIWVIKHFRLRFIHETGLSILYGIIIGLLIRYTSIDPVSNVTTFYAQSINNTDPPDDVVLQVQRNDTSKDYTCHKSAPTELGSKMVFDPEIFFYVLLPPIIFHAGYSMKRRHFFRNFGAIITFAFVGTLISTFTIGGILYGVMQGIRPAVGAEGPTFEFRDCLWYGSIISATDPVTVLAIFHDLNVDVDLYALVFGESVLNDAVAIVLAKAIDEGRQGTESVESVFKTIGNFFGLFLGSFGIGLVIGCINALLTKFTKIRDFPLLESSLLLLMSYASYLIAETFTMSGIVSVLFCGIFQAHYTFNNLSDVSKKSTKQVIEMLNFVTENFVFLYIGVSVFTRNYKSADWNPWFIVGAFFAMIISRALNVYPLSFLLNLGRKNKISSSIQHMMMFSGLRGAIAFALAIKKASDSTDLSLIMLNSTIILVIVTVIGCGVFTLSMLQWLKIRVGVDDPTEGQTFNPPLELPRSYDSTCDSPAHWAEGAVDNGASAASSVSEPPMTIAERARMVKYWNKLDNLIFKPILTNYRLTLAENFPESRGCGLLSRLCTTPEQFSNCARHTSGEDEDNDSDIDMIIDADELTLNHPGHEQTQENTRNTII